MTDDNTLPRGVAQELLTKLDLNAITPSYAKQHALRYYRCKLAGRSRDQVAKSINAAIRKEG